MKLSSSVLFLPILGTAVLAFPNLGALPKSFERAPKESWYEDLKRQVENHPKVRERLLVGSLTTPIDVTGDHAFVAPDFDNGDQRGPCPGLNALANHNYIPHNGVTSLIDTIVGVNTVFGMGIELITLLATMGTVGVGDPLSLNPGFSIGGYTPEVSNLLDNVGGLLGTPRGLEGSHNWIEADSSNTRDDLYVTGDASTMNMTLFLQIANGSDSEIITMEDVGKRAADRLEVSIATNPYFYFGPYTGLIVRNAGYAFSGRLLSNHTIEHPDGIMTQGTMRSMYGVYSEDGTYVYKKGCEQIPPNWYRIPVDYGLVSLNVDLLTWIGKNPILGSIGGNTGQVNTFTGVDLSNITGGVLNAETLLEGNNLMCFALEVVKTFAPNSLSPLFATLAVPLQLLNDAVNTSILDLTGCPDFADLSMGGVSFFEALQDTYPGAAKSGVAF
ncbi:hypothetical protein SBOR_0871 [Sclerotinia borealis F-4128]|uniref:Heme haloperoxidase family profile domain-containing protein n=1 Tax=Sclerotinia borealis (strain F-4128) TaxID=1432307 RepID=W9CW20_SCLBF|nr:hypothetical protein SBOR_0871 [Sclerotinia borealis F-4128]